MRVDLTNKNTILNENFHVLENDLYNNEMLGAISLYYIIEKVTMLNSSKAMLVLPLVLHNDLISYINNSRTNAKSLEQLIVKKPEFFSNFNQRFYSLIDLSINSILILIKLDLVSINKSGQLALKSSIDLLLRGNDISLLGQRAKKIIQASSSIASLLNDSNENLYLQLRVKL